MKKSFLVAILVLVAVAAVCLAADTISVAGKWKLTMTTPRGEQTREYTFTQDGEKITLAWTGRDGAEQKTEGTLKGSDIQWSVTRPGPNGDVTMTYKGKVEGNTMKGTVDSPMGAIDWKAEKVETK